RLNPPGIQDASSVAKHRHVVTAGSLLCLGLTCPADTSHPGCQAGLTAGCTVWERCQAVWCAPQDCVARLGPLLRQLALPGALQHFCGTAVLTAGWPRAVSVTLRGSIHRDGSSVTRGSLRREKDG